MKVYIGTNRDVGRRCIDWAKQNMPEGWEISEDVDDCDVFISVLYLYLLKPEYIEKHRCYNFHPGILPHYRGSGTCSWVIINGEKEAGVTLHHIDAGIDTGPYIQIYTFPIEDGDTAETVFRKTERSIELLFHSYFLCLLNGNVAKLPQPEGGHTYYRKDLEKLKDLSPIVRALTFEGKEGPYFINSSGERIYLDYHDEAY